MHADGPGPSTRLQAYASLRSRPVAAGGGASGALDGAEHAGVGGPIGGALGVGDLRDRPQHAPGPDAFEVDLGRADAIRVRRSENGYAVELTETASHAIAHALGEIMRLLDETETHARTGRTKGYYQDLLAQTFGT